MIPLPLSEDSSDVPLPERLLVNLSEKLFSLPRGRDIAVQYLSSCPRAGEEALRALIQRVQVSLSFCAAVYCPKTLAQLISAFVVSLFLLFILWAFLLLFLIVFAPGTESSSTLIVVD